MCPIIKIKYKISDKNIEIIINKNIKELNHSEIIDIYLSIYTIRNYEIKNGNEMEKCQLFLSYKKEMVIKEYINIFTLIRYGTFIEIYKYFKYFNEIKNIQEMNSNVNINEYKWSIDDIKQSIIINWLFNTKINNDILIKEKKNNKKILMIDDIKISDENLI